MTLNPGILLSWGMHHPWVKSTLVKKWGPEKIAAQSCTLRTVPSPSNTSALIVAHELLMFRRRRRCRLYLQCENRGAESPWGQSWVIPPASTKKVLCTPTSFLRGLGKKVRTFWLPPVFQNSSKSRNSGSEGVGTSRLWVDNSICTNDCNSPAFIMGEARQSYPQLKVHEHVEPFERPLLVVHSKRSLGVSPKQPPLARPPCRSF